ncbi:MAG: NAD(P)H-binding protein [Blastochloris sp.]|nr:NAD(P)H-binding protein [Blastochloris sp.]
MILVTGGTGFVGREVVKQLLDAGHQVRVLVRDPADLGKKPSIPVRKSSVATSSTPFLWPGP